VPEDIVSSYESRQISDGASDDVIDGRPQVGA
jgi:hypothetical protein